MSPLDAETGLLSISFAGDHSSDVNFTSADFYNLGEDTIFYDTHALNKLFSSSSLNMGRNVLKYFLSRLEILEKIFLGQIEYDLISCLSRCFQVMGIPRKGGQCLAVIYSSIVVLNTKLFTRYVRRHPSKKINTKKLPEKLLRCLREP